MTRKRVLFLCTGNSARSQMAEAYLNRFGGDEFEAFSAGLEPAPIRPQTIEVMQEDGIDLIALNHTSKGLIENFFDKQVHVSYLITVCQKAEDTCPIYPWAGEREFWNIEDPAAFEGAEEEKLDFFRKTRDTIKEKVADLVARLGS